MAHGDQIETGPNTTYLSSHLAYRLLDAAAAITPGAWIDVRGLRHWTIDITGTFVATIQVQGSNAPARPGASEDGNQLGELVTAAGIIDAQVPMRWMKTRVTLYTSGIINAFFHGVPH